MMSAVLSRTLAAVRCARPVFAGSMTAGVFISSWLSVRAMSSSVTKRFRLMGNGRIKRKAAGQSHFNSCKGSRLRLAKRQIRSLDDATRREQNKIRKALLRIK
mmetsp:Transcript_12530/g.50371  ORF Transcript_12530/g.50371 Transcript_12530/m.50371 type:complete len:103 (-) Transcript_12530:317-625(-)